MAEIFPETARRDEALQLTLDLRVGQAVGDRTVDRALACGKWLRVKEAAAEGRGVS